VSNGATPAPPPRHTYVWWLVLCLVGLDYFSSLAYLPTIAMLEVKALAPIAAVGVAAITLLAALPVYAYVVGRSPHGKGAAGLLERAIPGWRGKFLLLVLLGFVATDFVITRSLSSADASTHLLANPIWKDHSSWVTQHKDEVRSWLPGWLRGRFFDFWDEQLVLTLVLSLLAFILYTFLVRGMTRGFLRLAAGVVAVYLLLNAVVIGLGLAYIKAHPDPVADWRALLRQQWEEGRLEGNPWYFWVWLALRAFPPMALGLSGFELSTASAPLVRAPESDPADSPHGRIRRTRLMLLVAAVVMSVFVVGAQFVVSLLVPPESVETAGRVQHRALAYLAHGGAILGGGKVSPLFGNTFGTLYDLSSVVILCLAGASATISLRDLVPEFLHRFGMELEWAHKVGVIQHLFNVVILLVTVVFRASVTAQHWAYATSVLALLIGASLAALADLARHWRGSWLRPLVSLPFFLMTGLFLLMGFLTVVQGPSGVAIALAFIAVVFATAILSRWLRSTEMRFSGFTFADDESKARWDEICKFEFQVLVPHRPGLHSLQYKEHEIRTRHRVAPEVPIIFIQAELGDPSEFFQTPVMRVLEDDGRTVIHVARCSSVAHVLAAVGLAFREVGKPPEIHFGWSNESPLTANLNFLLLGQGNIPWMVRELLRKAEPDPLRQPRVVIG
jgi:hypothetical protein